MGPRHDAPPERPGAAGQRGGGLRAAGRSAGPLIAALLGATMVSCATGSDDERAQPPSGSGWDAQADAPADASVNDGDRNDGGDAQTCSPATCVELGAQCGSAPDLCGGSVSCGECPSGLTCGGAGPNQCGTTECWPKTCGQLNASCGVVSDGCGATLNCGSCTLPETCSTNHQCGCVPASCAALGTECGMVPDGCGAVVDCGDCPPGEICGGGGPNQCGSGPCEPLTCATAGVACGQVPDGCNGVLSCGSCTPPETCGGGGVPNQCGCTPTTCAALGAQCGSVANGCGGSLDCGACPGNGPCIASTHQCQPADCNNKLCGSPDGIGGTCLPGSGCCGGIASGFSLPKGAGINSCGGAIHLEHQSDGNVVVYQYSNGIALWSSVTAGLDTNRLDMQGDGNLVLYGPSNEVYWLSNTAGYTGAYAALQEDCNFVLYQGAAAIWASAQTCQ